MSDNEFQTIGLYPHNINSYKKIKKAISTGEKIIGIVHATGTGKSYNALQLAYDNKDKKIVYIVPSNSIIEHIKEIIDNHPKLDIQRDFPNLEFITYQSLVNLSAKEIKELNIDIMILDEFHHIGAPIWGSRINKIIETHPNIKIFGMTAYTIRDRGTPYERDMTNQDGREIFSNKIVSIYNICDAMIDGVLPKPIYKSAHINLIEMEEKLEKRVQKLNPESKDYKELMELLKNVKKRIHEAPSIPKLLKKTIKPNGKYIYFCPPNSENGINDIETIKKQALEWFKQFIPEEDIVVYTSTSDMGIIGKKNRKAFYNDTTLDGEKVDKKLRIMFAINQYNEGVHIPNIDGVIMGRGTSSDIVYFEQLGRALSARGNTKDYFEELEKKSKEELIELCKSKDILIKENITKEDLIEKLIAPVIIDLTDNYSFIKQLENNLKDKIKEAQINNSLNHQSRKLKIIDATFDIEIENHDLFQTLELVLNRLSLTWDDKYELAKKYFEHHGNLEVPHTFRTIDGYTYDENGYSLGFWIANQRQAYKGNGRITEEQIEQLKKLGMRFETMNTMGNWQVKYELAKKYFEHHGNLEVPHPFRTIDGYTYDENGYALGKWITNQRQAYKGNGKITEEQIEQLKKIGMRFKTINIMEKWQAKYELAKKYFEHHGDLEVPQSFKTNDGYTYDENGYALGFWISNQRQAYKGNGRITEEQIEQLKKIGMRFKLIRTNRMNRRKEWIESYELAKKYFEHHGNLEVPQFFRTIDGYTYDENGYSLGLWVITQRQAYKGNGNHKITEEQIEQLKKIGMNFEPNKKKEWIESYELAKKYFEHHGNLETPNSFRTIDGYTYDENGYSLGFWVSAQRRAYKVNDRITEEQIEQLKKIGMRFETRRSKEWIESYELAKKYFEHHGNLEVPHPFRTIDGYTYDENGYSLGTWISNQRQAYKGHENHKITEEQIEQLKKLGMRFEPNRKKEWQAKYELAKKYFEQHGNLEVPQHFRTIDGYTYDENGYALGKWIKTQILAYKGNGHLKITEEHIKLLEEISIRWFKESINQKLQQEEITSSNKNRKRIEILNRLKTLLNKKDGTMPINKEEINQEFLNELDYKLCKKKSIN